MRRIPFILGLIFIAVTTKRVADFAGSTIQAWLMAIALTCSVFVSAYYLDFKDTSKKAALALIVLAFLDMVFNLGDTLKSSVETGRWDFTIQFSDKSGLPIYRWADFIYGLFPTIGAILMAYLARAVERLPVSRRKGTLKEKLTLWLSEWLTGNLPEPSGKTSESKEKEKSVPEPSKDLPEWLPVVPANVKEFQNLIRSGKVALPKKITGAELAKYVPVSPRSAQNWLASVRNGNGTSGDSQ